MVIAKEPTRCKLELIGVIIDQVMSFIYLGIEIIRSRDRGPEVVTQLNKAKIIARYLRDTIWRNK